MSRSLCSPKSDKNTWDNFLALPVTRNYGRVFWNAKSPGALNRTSGEIIARIRSATFITFEDRIVTVAGGVVVCTMLQACGREKCERLRARSPTWRRPFQGTFL